MADITAELTGGTTVRIASGRHTWHADEPPDIGADEGPTPYELLLGALAACVCITVALYCRRKDWALDNVSAEYSFDRVHADDCEDCEDDATGYLDRVRARVFIDGDFDDAQRERLAEIVERCPVHKTLERGIMFGEEEIHVA
jgi:putative redox protein